jgi:hypothetical protein
VHSTLDIISSWCQPERVDEPLSPPTAKRLIQRIRIEGTVWTSSHADDEMLKDNLSMMDVNNVLRGGWVEPAEFENGSWRYRVCTPRIVVVVAFDSEDTLTVVTAWRVR